MYPLCVEGRRTPVRSFVCSFPVQETENSKSRFILNGSSDRVVLYPFQYSLTERIWIAVKRVHPFSIEHRFLVKID